MKILVLAEDGSMRNATTWDALRDAHECEIRFFGKGGLAPALESVSAQAFDRVVLCGGFRRSGPQVLALRKLPEVVIYDLDLQQDYMPDSKYFGLFPPLFKTLGRVSLIVTSMAAEEHYARKGFVVSYVPKAYDHRLISCTHTPRDIEFGFIGRTGNVLYRERRRLLAEVSRCLPVEQLRTVDLSEENDEYARTLNRIRFFISVDAGFREYHIKNFEALAAGCVLCALTTSQAENAFLGFEDMRNVVLYATADELVDKIATVRNTPGLAESIASAGRELAESAHQWRHRRDLLEQALSRAPAEPPPMSMQERLLYLKARCYWALSQK
ncbi:glycosyltransferase family protein [Rhodocyclaceae bacterium SMB388]